MNLNLIFRVIKRQLIKNQRNRKEFTIILLIIIFGLIYFFISRSPIDPYIKPLPVVTFQSNCSSLFSEETDPTIFKSAESWRTPTEETLSDAELGQIIKADCHGFLERRKYLLDLPTYSDERDFPIAFSILTFKSASQFERLLRMIYRPWNYYCIHVDLKSSRDLFEAVDNLSICLNSRFGNVINVVERLPVVWGEFSVLQADITCMKELFRRFADWWYFINLTGQEFPLKTNWEIVRILRAFRGANNVDGTYGFRDEDRIPTTVLPFPIIWFKGSVHVTVNRDFVKFIVESDISKSMLNALDGTRVPDEQFFSSLNYNVQFRIPGSFIGDPDELITKYGSVPYFITRFKNRGQYSCISREIVRGLCIWGVGDLPKLVTAPHLFSNKFYENFQPLTLHCLEKWYYEKVRKEVLTRKVTLDERFYSSLPFVKYRYVPPSQNEQREF